jgi:hypothetical protein
MKVKTISSFLSVLALVVLAGVLAPRIAKAQEESGRFTLPTEVHWGGATLPAGDYTFSLNSLDSSSRLYVYKESSPASGYMFTPQDWDIIPVTPEKSRLILDQRDGEAYVKEMVFGSEGLVLHFAEAKSKK